MRERRGEEKRKKKNKNRVLSEPLKCDLVRMLIGAPSQFDSD
jgi:hypothetical protein